MKKICLQAGHVNKPGGGAPEEQANNKRITDRLSSVLRSRGYEVYQTDYYAFNDTKVTGTDWDLFLALHCDMDYPNDGGSGFADFAEPSTDSTTSESQRICKIINDNYFPEVKINYVNHSNANTRFYYMWKSLSPKTPCVLLEMGQSIDPHDKVLLANTDLIANAIAMCLDKAFGVSVPSDCLNHLKEISDLKLYQKDLESKVSELARELDISQKSEASCQSALKTANKTNQIISKDLAYFKPYKALYEKALKTTIDKFSGVQLILMGLKKLLINK